MSTMNMKQEDHPAHDMPEASEQYAGDVHDVSWQTQRGNTGESSDAVDYALGKKTDPKVLPIGNKTLGDWAKRKQG